MDLHPHATMHPVMDPAPSNGRCFIAPGLRRLTMHDVPAKGFLPRPYHDERLVEPETREEIVRGRRIHAMPANPEHGDRHLEVDRVIGTNIAPGYVGSSDLLTRAGPRSDFATDTSVRRAGIDPRTGSRYLEELAFEVVNEQSMRHMIERAEDLTACGVRRLIAIFVKRGEVCEWSGAEGRWIPLDLEGSIDDPTLIRPVPIRALLDTSHADDAVVRALESKGNRRLTELRADGLTRAIETACTLLEITIGPDRRQHLGGLELSGLAALLEHLETHRRWP